MRYEKFIYGSGTLLIMAGAIMSIQHLPYANVILLGGLTGTILFQTRHISVLKKRILELEHDR